MVTIPWEFAAFLTSVTIYHLSEYAITAVYNRSQLQWQCASCP